MVTAHPFLPLIAETLTATGARDVIAVGPLPWPAEAVPPRRLELTAALAAAAPRAELAIVSLVPGQEGSEARRLIAVLRDLLARRLLAFVPENLLQDTALIGLALQRQARLALDGEIWQAWSYDIRTYKTVPDWLNPRFWANPENWDKYRW